MGVTFDPTEPDVEIAKEPGDSVATGGRVRVHYGMIIVLGGDTAVNWTSSPFGADSVTRT
jgi:hypothetical protein